MFWSIYITSRPRRQTEILIKYAMESACFFDRCNDFLNKCKVDFSRVFEILISEFLNSNTFWLWYHMKQICCDRLLVRSKSCYKIENMWCWFLSWLNMKNSICHNLAHEFTLDITKRKAITLNAVMCTFPCVYSWKYTNKTGLYLPRVNANTYKTSIKKNPIIVFLAHTGEMIIYFLCIYTS